MSAKHQKYANMLFEYETTNKTDLKPHKIKGELNPEIQQRPTCVWPRPKPLKGIHTLTEWKASPPPFSVTHKPKEIVRTNPHDVQEPYVKPPDPELDRIRKTRPRLVMTPAVSMDDIVNEEARRILLEDIYTSNSGRANAEVETQYFSVKAPIPPHPSPAMPITLPLLKPPYVPPEWRMESMRWDRQQLRAHCDPSERFWAEYKHKNPCTACQQSKVLESQKKMLQAMRG